MWPLESISSAIEGRRTQLLDDLTVFQFLYSSYQGHKEWINEVNFLGVVKHPNLVKLVGYCADDDERGIQRLLVYELMRNKSLEDHLLNRLASPLPWITRLRIAQDAARGLAYLHEEMEFQVIMSLYHYYIWLRFIVNAKTPLIPNSAGAIASKL